MAVALGRDGQFFKNLGYRISASPLRPYTMQSQGARAVVGSDLRSHRYYWSTISSTTTLPARRFRISLSVSRM